MNQLAEEMRTNHPALLAADSRTNAAAAGLAAVRTWEDPMIQVGGMAAEETMRAEDGDILYGVEQKLPLFGKPAAARRVARAELGVEMANADYQFQILKSELAKVAFRAGAGRTDRRDWRTGPDLAANDGRRHGGQIPIRPGHPGRVPASPERAGQAHDPTSDRSGQPYALAGQFEPPIGS